MTPSSLRWAQRARERAHVRPVFLALAFFFLGIAVSAVWHYRTAGHGTMNGGRETGGKLSDRTKDVLRRLDSPVEIRFYSVLEGAGVPDSLHALAGRVGELLSEYQREANGKILLTRCQSRSDSAKAAADGIKPFNAGKGETGYLGLAVAQHDRKESLPELAPEWEPAFEFDLTRAILRVMETKPPTAHPTAASPADPAVAEEVKRAIPNFTTVSVEEGKKMLTAAALQDFKAAANEMETQIKVAEQRFIQAQSGGSEAEQQAALKQLQSIRASQAEKLKDIAGRLSSQIATWERIKAE